jgi:heme o synthase
MVPPEGHGEGNSRIGLRSRVAAFISLAKPGLTLMSVSTALAGGLLAPRGIDSPWRLLAIAAGTLFVGGGAVALNQYREREFDALMQRTRKRPLPTGLLRPEQALFFGILVAAAGIAILATTTLLATVLALVTLFTYVLVYTPMKRSTHFATAVGGLPGAIPPVIGWTAITGTMSLEAYILFLVLFLWQMPHFLSLGWMYRKDYELGGYRLLPSLDRTGAVTARIIMVYTCALLPASVLPFILGMAGILFLGLVIVLWLSFFIPVLRLSREISDAHARRVFYASLVYVPAFFLAIGVDRILGL